MVAGTPRVSNMERIGVVVALPAEARTLAHRCPSNFEIIVSGPGPARAADGATRLVAGGVRALLSWGTSGALAPALRPGRILLATEVHDDAGRWFASDAQWLRRAADELAPLAPVAARSATTAAPVSTGGAKRRLGQDTGCAAVDMEAAAVAGVASARGLPFLAVRSIVDPVDCELPHCVLSSLRPSGAAHLPALLAGLLRRPWEVAGLVRLAIHFNTALRALRDAAHLLSDSPNRVPERCA